MFNGVLLVAIIATTLSITKKNNDDFDIHVDELKRFYKSPGRSRCVWEEYASKATLKKGMRTINLLKYSRRRLL